MFRPHVDPPQCGRRRVEIMPRAAIDLLPDALRGLVADGRPVPFPLPIEVETSGVRIAAGDVAALGVVGVLERIARETGPRKAPNGEEFHVRITASSDRLARDNMIIPLKAWTEGGRLDRFRQNPALLFAHSHHQPPIGSVVDLRFTGRKDGALTRGTGRMRQWWRFHDVGGLSQEVHALYELGEMRAASVGFRIHLWHRVDEQELKRLKRHEPDANEFTLIADEVELYETSAVPIGADVEALAGRALFSGEPDVLEALDEPTRGFVRGWQGVADQLGDPVELARVSQAFEEVVEACRLGNAEACRRLAVRPIRTCARRGRALDPTEDEPADDEQGRAAIGFASAHVPGSYAVAPRTAPWSAAAEVGKMAATAAALRTRHAWVEADGDADTKRAYKFPHHRAAANAAVVFRALAQGFARLDQANVPDGDKDGIARHLARHYRDDYDAEPPDRAEVAEAVRTYAGLEERADIATWAAGHAATLERLGAGDVALAVAAVADAAAAPGREEEPGDEDDVVFELDEDEAPDPAGDLVEIDEADVDELVEAALAVS